MKTVTYQRTLLYYDGPQVIVARDLSGNVHIGILVDRNGAADVFVVVQVSRQFLELFLNGLVDLRRVLYARSVPVWYLARVSDDFSTPIRLEPQGTDLESTSYLPEPGLFIQEKDCQFQSVIVSQDVYSVAYGSPHIEGNWSDQDLLQLFPDDPRAQLESDETGLELAA